MKQTTDIEENTDRISPETGMVAVIAGAGPAGLTAAAELLDTDGVCPVLFEADSIVGGISRTVNYRGNRIDIGGHRFFSKNDRIMYWWTRVMPLEGDPEVADRAMLRRNRVSRIYYLRSFFDYPVKMSMQTIRNLGLWRTVRAGLSYIAATIAPRKEQSLEDFYINRFGKVLYGMFFEDYTEKVWGVHPSRLSADWGAQRVKGLSIMAVLKDMARSGFGRKDASLEQKQTETSLIESFIYPKHGPGQLWEYVAEDIQKRGARLEMNMRVKTVNCRDGRVRSVTVESADGSEREVSCDWFLSSMPVKDLIEALRGIEVPDNVRQAASVLPYRDFITVGLLVDRLKIGGGNPVPDTWIYIQERDVRLGRLQIFNNWSPYMVADPAKVWIGLEYFCSEGDAMWRMSDSDFIEMAKAELEKIGIIDAADVVDAVRIRMPKAYPGYFGSYSEMPAIREFLSSIPNLYCIGRNGQHRYNNMDHSMLTAMEAVKLIRSGSTDQRALWNVNTEQDYHESVLSEGPAASSADRDGDTD